ncbi:MAG: DEAD/DEAH box helicase [Acidimicrobiia bacterium]|nr:DEAD/DEAH box helicase [Acidimicrobiia bacterium]
MDAIVDDWLSDPNTRVAHLETIRERGAIYAGLDPPLSDPVRARLAELGIDRLYRHQARAIEHIREGAHTVLVAGTASGKSLCYQVPIVEALVADDSTTALLLYPTKALAQDQLRSIHRMATPEVVEATYDGDTDREQRTWVRKHANVVLTNPDMLHVGILPHHGMWAHFLSRLRFVVVDEMHLLRGVFGSHVSLVLRRLRRLAAHYGASPTFVFTSATIGNPGDLAASLTGLPAVLVDEDTSPTGTKHYVLWNPPLLENGDGQRASALGEATDVFLDLIGRDLDTIAFTRSRKGTELMYRWAKERLEPAVAQSIAAYRGGYLPAERRKIEAELFAGNLRGVVTTNALELGIDVGTLDAAVLTTYPGTIASFRQQTGRAGRTTDESLAVLVGGQDALDQYFMTHPEELFDREPEAAVINPANPEILGAHIGCAAYELPLDPADREYLGDGLEERAAELVHQDRLRVRDGKLFWASRRSPAPDVGIRSAGAGPYDIVDDTSGKLLGTLDEGAAFMQAHAGAVYLHQGETFLVEKLDLSAREARVVPAKVGYYTQPKEEKWIGLREIVARTRLGRFTLAHGRVEVESTVVAYQRKEIRTRQILGYEGLDLPPRQYETQAFWFEVPDSLIDAAGIAPVDLPGTLHAAEHAAIGMLPLFAICDRWDIGGLSTAMHPEIGGAVWFIYDGYPGGAGIAPVGYDHGRRLLTATMEAIRACPCESGCPSCVQSPKCGNFNDPLDKTGAVRLLEVGLA